MSLFEFSFQNSDDIVDSALLEVGAAHQFIGCDFQNALCRIAANGFECVEYPAINLIGKLFKGDIQVTTDTENLPKTKVAKVDDQGAIKG